MAEFRKNPIYTTVYIVCNTLFMGRLSNILLNTLSFVFVIPFLIRRCSHSHPRYFEPQDYSRSQEGEQKAQQHFHCTEKVWQLKRK